MSRPPRIVPGARARATALKNVAPLTADIRATCDAMDDAPDPETLHRLAGEAMNTALRVVTHVEPIWTNTLAALNVRSV